MKRTGGALDGIRVIDASQMLAGPICAMRLGDLGADVIKVEPTGAGEHNRTHGFGPTRIGGETPTFLGLNRNKRSIALDLKHPDGLATLRDLVRGSDVFLQNYRVGTAERLGVGWEQLRAINRRLVYAQISGYGEDGPYRDRPGQDLLVQAMSGSMWSVGAAADPPQPGAIWAVDAMTGYQAAIGILAALIARGRSGEGQKVSVSMLGAALDAQSQELVTFLNSGLAPERPETRTAHALIPAPYGVYRAADGWLVLAMAPLAALGEALDDDRLRGMDDEIDGTTSRAEIDAILGPILATRTTAGWIAFFDERRLWSGRVYTYAELAADPHVLATGAFVDVDHPVAGRLRMPAPPIRLSATDSAVRLPPPRHGEHGDEVLAEIAGYDAARIAALRASGALGGTSGQAVSQEVVR
ncbi:MAG TPA: CoA transferase [Candidatus Limnocylindrales bacterium]|nr:CoA transferase [Candidatus Limnocylindrales bacterium]